MKTLIIRLGRRHVIRAVATEADDGGRDKCAILAFLQEQRNEWPKELDKLGAILSDTCENGPPRDPTKFKKLEGSDGIYEFKSPQGLRLLCFWDDDGLIICTHGYVKDGQKAPKNEIERADRIKRDYFNCKTQGTLTHGNQRQ